MKKKIIMEVTEKEYKEIYNALACLNTQIRNKQKLRAKFIQQILNDFDY